MEIDDRYFESAKARNAFGTFWCETHLKVGTADFPNRRPYADSYLILNRLERYWIESFRKGILSKDAASAWKAADLSDCELSADVSLFGDRLAELVAANDLTYVEIFEIFVDVLSLDVKYHRRREKVNEDDEDEDVENGVSEEDAD
jgi:hypothetical protein